MSNIGNAESFGDKYVDELSEFFGKQVKFTAQWAEACGEEFSTPASGKVKDHKSQCTSFRRFVFPNFMGKNPRTGSPRATKDVLVSLLTKDSPSWLKPNTILYRIMIPFFSMVTETPDIEHLMSIFCLQDTKLTQARAPARVEQMVLIHKESPSWNDFHSFTALLIWRSLKTRKVPLLPLPARLPTDKNWVKPPSQLKEAHNKRQIQWEKRFRKKTTAEFLEDERQFEIDGSDEDTDVEMDKDEDEEAKEIEEGDDGKKDKSEQNDNKEELDEGNDASGEEDSDCLDNRNTNSDEDKDTNFDECRQDLETLKDHLEGRLQMTNA